MHTSVVKPKHGKIFASYSCPACAHQEMRVASIAVVAAPKASKPAKASKAKRGAR